MIVHVALVVFPNNTLSFNDEGMVKLRLNSSSLSATLSKITVILTVALVDPAVKVALIGVES